MVRLFHGSFACVLPSFEYHFNSLLLIFISGICSEIPGLLSHVLQKPVICRIWVWGISEQITNSFISFFCLLMLYFCVAPSQVFFEHVFGKSFNLYIRNFLIELHFVFIAFILLLIVLLCFWSYSGRYSFYTFCLMHSLKKVFEQTEI